MGSQIQVYRLTQDGIIQFNKQAKFVNTSGSPFTVNSSTVVSNLNADLLDGKDASAFSLTSHNHDSTYLKLSGGTITGPLTCSSTGSYRANLNLISASDVPNDLYFGSNGSQHWSITSRSSSEGNYLGFYSTSSNGGWAATVNYSTKVWNFTVNPTVGGNAVIHSGNINSQSVNYATSAGSVSWANVSSKPSTAGDATTPVYWTGSGFTTCTAYSSASVNYAATAGTANMIANNITITGTSTIDNGISFSNGTRSIFFGNGSSGNSGIYTPTEGWLVGISPSGSVFLNGNATSAIKLATSRTIWGQNFDGTGNVSGNMSDVGSIDNILHFKTAGANTKLNIEELSLTINGTHLFVASQSGTYTNSRPLILQYGYGNVGIGVTAPEYKLDVSGDVKATNFRGALIGNADTATSATNAGNADTVDNEHASAFVHITGSTMTGNLLVQKAADSEPKIGVYQEGYSPIYLTSGSQSKNRGLYCAELGWLCGWTANDVAFFNGNASSATTLATSRTIWGQNFNGSANISGAMSNVGTINSRLNILNTYHSALLNIDCLNQSGPAYLHIYVSSANSDYATSRPLVLQNGYGPVGIGVTNPTYKLEVNGDVKATNFRGALIGNADTATTATSATTATTASKLSTVSKTAWGQTYWTAGGVPTTISGAMTDVTTIDGYVSFTTKQSNNPVLNISTIYAATDYISVYVTATHRPLVLQLDAGNVGIGVAQPSYKLDVNGSANATTLYESGNRVITSGNIGSQSVNYATSAGSASSVPSLSNSEIDTIMV